MGKVEREPYERQAKEEKEYLKSMPAEDRPVRYVATKPRQQQDIMTSQGVPYSMLQREREERIQKEESAKLRIRQLVENGFDLDCEFWWCYSVFYILILSLNFVTVIKEQPFYFMAAVYFCMTNDHVYIPAEVAVSSYTFENGIVSKYHTFVDPGEFWDIVTCNWNCLIHRIYIRLGTLPMGYAYEAREHATKTHQLERPPNAMGEKSLMRIRHEIIQFIMPKNGFNQSSATKHDLVVFVNETNKEIVESVLAQLAAEDVDNLIEILVFPLEELFFALKKKALDMCRGDDHSIKHISISNLLLEKDPYRNLDGIACNVSNGHCA